MATREEIDALGHGIAYDAACSVIECHCVKVDGCDISQGFDWWDVTPEVVDEYGRDGVEEGVRYLGMRGLIVRHAANPNWVQLQDESEATA